MEKRQVTKNMVVLYAVCAICWTLCLVLRIAESAPINEIGWNFFLALMWALVAMKMYSTYRKQSQEGESNEN